MSASMPAGSSSVRTWLGRVCLVGSLSLTLISLPPVDASSAEKVESQVRQDAADGQATYWVLLGEQADLSAASAISDWALRGDFVHGRLTSLAATTQAGLRGWLRARDVAFQSYWIVNGLRVTSDEPTLEAIAARPEVREIVADETWSIPAPVPGTEAPSGETAEWNVERSGATKAWSTFGVRGEEVVIGSIDTGVRYTHAALVRQYRGRRADGSFAHDYNWFDPGKVCWSPGRAPCDNSGHGTHTMGTLVGDDGTNRIGVAPGAKWVTAMGCEMHFFCSIGSLLASGQWMLAPTDLDGRNPRPDLRPHVLNNSWGSPDGSSQIFRSMVESWVAAGMFPVFANGNTGAECKTVGAPASYPESYGVGAFDSEGNIAEFSSRGPSPSGDTKPNITAPGVNIRSSWRDGGYSVSSGTSMAAPHVAATVALMWSAAPGLIGDLPRTRSLLDGSAVDVDDRTCGGAANNNEVWGEGTLDAFAAVQASPIGPTGTLKGTAVDAVTSLPIEGAKITAVGPVTRTTKTNLLGEFSLVLPAGTYDARAWAFGYATRTATGLAVAEGVTVSQRFALAASGRYVVSGQVLDEAGGGVWGATVRLLGAPTPSVTTSADGTFRLADVPEGDYDLDAAPGPCMRGTTTPISVDGNETVDPTVVRRFDTHGYSCREGPQQWVDGTTAVSGLGLNSHAAVSLPFPFPFYGEGYNRAYICSNGYLSFQPFAQSTCGFSNHPAPFPWEPNAAIFPFWEDLTVDALASVRTVSLGSSPSRRFVIEWRNIQWDGEPARRISFQVILHEDGRILMQHRDVGDDDLERGSSATVGIEDAAGRQGLQYSFNEPVVSEGLSIAFQVPPSRVVEGVITDANDGLPLPRATVRAVGSAGEFRQIVTGDDGAYRMRLPVGRYHLEVSASRYGPLSSDVVVDEPPPWQPPPSEEECKEREELGEPCEEQQPEETIRRDFALPTSRAEVGPASLSFLVPQGQTAKRAITIANSGALELAWESGEAGGSRVQTTVAPASTTAAADPDARTTQGTSAASSGWSATSKGEVIRSWAPTGFQGWPYGVGQTGFGGSSRIWVSDVPWVAANQEFTRTGEAGGRRWVFPWAADTWAADLAYVAGRGLMCQLSVGGADAIHCWDPSTGEERELIKGDAWSVTSQRGLAYRPDDDTFYVGGWNQGIIYHIAGLSHEEPGAELGRCTPPDGAISGLAYNAEAGALWMATNGSSDTVYQLDPETCSVISTVAHPSPGFNGGGLEIDEEGNLWMVSQSGGRVYLVESGLPAFTDVPWLSVAPPSGSLAPGARQDVEVTVDAKGLAPGVHSAVVVLATNAGRERSVQVPVMVAVPAYRQGVNAGDGAYTDIGGQIWDPDRAFTPGSWGYVGKAGTSSTTREISGTEDDTLYRSQRRGSQLEYRFDALPPGVYEVELRFAEIRNQGPGRRAFDVYLDDQIVLSGHDIAATKGLFAADDHAFFTNVGDGTLVIRLVAGRSHEAVLNGVRVTHRPDR